VTGQLVPEIHPDVYFTVENDELVLTWTRYWVEPPGLVFVDAFQLRVTAQVVEQLPLETDLSVGAVGGLGGGVPQGVTTFHCCLES
jgi:hypothetical protein